MRANLLTKIEQVKEELKTCRHQYTKERLVASLKQLELNLRNYDAHGDKVALEQMVFEHSISAA